MAGGAAAQAGLDRRAHQRAPAGPALCPGGALDRPRLAQGGCPRGGAGPPVPQPQGGGAPRRPARGAPRRPPAPGGLGGRGAGRQRPLGPCGALPRSADGPAVVHRPGTGAPGGPGHGVAERISCPGAAQRQHPPPGSAEKFPAGGGIPGLLRGPRTVPGGLGALSLCPPLLLRAGDRRLLRRPARGQGAGYAVHGGIPPDPALQGGPGGGVVGVVRAPGHPHQPRPPHRPQPQGRVPGGPGHAPPFRHPPGGHQHGEDLRRIPAPAAGPYGGVPRAIAPAPCPPGRRRTCGRRTPTWPPRRRSWTSSGAGTRR